MATVIGEKTFINGNLQGDEDLTVQGRLKGTVNSSRSLIVEQAGIVEAQVSVANAVISGVVVGNITATDAVELQAGGRMVGDIAAPRVIIVDGAAFRGNIDMGEVTGDRPARRPAAPRPTSTATPTQTARPAATSRPPAARPAPKPEPPRSKPVTKARKPERRAPPKPPAPGKRKKKILLKKKKR